MKTLFVDTGALFAKEIAGDQFHRQASDAWRELAELPAALYSSEHVFDETATLLARRSTYAWASDWGRDALDGSGIEWVQANPHELRQALTSMRKYADQGVSFTDCVSFVIMKRLGIRHVFGFDRHFESAGFKLWPGT